VAARLQQDSRQGSNSSPLGRPSAQSAQGLQTFATRRPIPESDSDEDSFGQGKGEARDVTTTSGVTLDASSDVVRLIQQAQGLEDTTAAMMATYVQRPDHEGSMDFPMMSILRRNLKDVAKATADPAMKKALATMADGVKTWYNQETAYMGTFDDRINSLTPSLDLGSACSSTFILNNVEGPTKMIAKFDSELPQV